MPLSPEIWITKDHARLSRKAAALFAEVASDAVINSGRFTVALSGGSTPSGMFRLLTGEPIAGKIPWEKIHLFWVDERCVPLTDPASNFGNTKKDLLLWIPLPEQNIHPMPAELPPEQGAEKYQEELMSFFQTRPGTVPVFDLICLGLGEDGHVASLFPDQEAMKEKWRLVSAVKGGHPYANRLTLTLPVLNRARNVVFLVSGRQKAPVVRRVFQNRSGRLPAAKILPESGKLIWILDREAAAEISKDVSYAFLS